MLRSETLLYLLLVTGCAGPTAKGRRVRGVARAQRFTVKEGARYRLGELSIREKPASTDALGQPATLRARMSLRTGMWFDRSQLVNAAEKLLIHYRDAGYGKAKAHSVINLDAERKAVALALLIERGPKLMFGEIELSGLHTVPAGEIKQHVLVRRGQLYSHTNLEQTRRRLMQTGLFSQVSISVNKLAAQRTAVAETSPARLDVSIELVEDPAP